MEDKKSGIKRYSRTKHTVTIKYSKPFDKNHVYSEIHHILENC